jgi:N-acetylglutamate synthase-like GNAT family acetyltransferase
MKIREAMLSEYDTLSDLTLQSEAYWGYDNAFLEKFTMYYNITVDFIKNNHVYVLINNTNILGYYGLAIRDDISSLEFLFIEPKSIGNGYGKILWNHMIAVCQKNHVKEFTIVSDPHARNFYYNMGAKPYMEIDSKMTPGRNVLQLIYTI